MTVAAGRGAVVWLAVAVAALAAGCALPGPEGPAEVASRHAEEVEAASVPGVDPPSSPRVGGDAAAWEPRLAARDAVVRVRASGCETVRTGSAVAVASPDAVAAHPAAGPAGGGDATTVLLTAAHVVDGADRVDVVDAWGRRASSTRLEVVDDDGVDVARVEVDGRVGEPLRLGEPAPGWEEVALAGHPHGGAVEVASARSLVSRGEALVDAAIAPGFSGGPVVAGDGRLVGVVWARTPSSRALAVAGAPLREAAAGRGLRDGGCDAAG